MALTKVGAVGRKSREVIETDSATYGWRDDWIFWYLDQEALRKRLWLFDIVVLEVSSYGREVTQQSMPSDEQ